jgi:hypothetical protein
MNVASRVIAIMGTLASAEVLAAPTATQAPGLPQFDLRADEILNLVYQLDCLPSGDECPFQALWKEELGFTAQDVAALGRRQRIRERYQWQVRIDDSLDDGPLMFDVWRGLELRKKLLLAAAGAKDIAAYRDRLELVVTSTDAAELAAIAEAFLPRFRRFFAGASPQLRALVKDLSPYFERPAVRRATGQIMDFYEVPASQRGRLEIQLIALPARWKGPTRGEQVEHLSTVEVKSRSEKASDAEALASTATVTLHELFHYFYMTVPGDRTRGLAARFAASDDPGAPAAYGLLNEGLATALSAVTRKASLTPSQWQSKLRAGGSWYRDAAIDTVAKAILTWLEERLTHGQSLYEPSFVPGYLRIVRAAMGQTLDRPTMKLRTLVTALEEGFMKSAAGIISRAASPGVTVSSRPLDAPMARDTLLSHSQQSGVIMVRGGSLSQLAPWQPVLGKGIVERLTAIHRKHPAFIQAVKRESRSVIFILVAETPAEFDQLATRLTATEKPFDLLPLHD